VETEPEEVRERILIVCVNGHPLRALGGGVGGVKADGDIAFKVATDCVQRQTEAMAGSPVFGPIVIMAAAFVVGLVGLEGVGPAIDEEAEVIRHDRGMGNESKILHSLLSGLGGDGKAIFHVLSDPQRVHLLRSTDYRPRIAQLRLRKIVELLKYNGECKLIETVEAAKCQLSGQDKAHISFEYGHDAFDVVVTRRQFEKAIADETRSLKVCIGKVVEAASMTFKDIDAVFITGGSSQVPVIRRIFTDQFGEAKVKESNAFTSVGFGLGLTASHLSRRA
jgi:hypothetical protein